MSQRFAASLFPLPLTPFERYMLCDDRPDYPMTFAMRMMFAGQMRRAEFEAAFAETLAGHPLLTAIVKRSASRGWEWRSAEKQTPPINWGTPGEEISAPGGERIDLGREVGLRAWVRADDRTAEVTLQFHHACCDGSGAISFTRHLLAAYGLRTAESDMVPVLPQPDPHFLHNRWRFEFRPLAEKPRRFGLLGNGLRDGWRWLLRRPAPLFPARHALGDVESPWPFLELHYHAFTSEFSRRLRRAATRFGVTLGDLLLADLFAALRQWNLAHGDPAAKRWLRIAVPVKMRSIAQSEATAANVLSFNFITRLESRLDEREMLLRTIHHESSPAVRQRRTKMFVRALDLLSRMPWAIEGVVGSRRCRATAVLSNISNLNRMFANIPQSDGRLVVGNLVLEDIYGAPPVRPKTAAAFATGTYAGKMWLCLRRDPHALSADDARQLMAFYVKQLEVSAAEIV